MMGGLHIFRGWGQGGTKSEEQPKVITLLFPQSQYAYMPSVPDLLGQPSIFALSPTNAIA